MFNIAKFKAKGDCRKWLNNVFDIEGYLGAGNGHYLVLDVDSKSKFYGFPKLKDLINPKGKGKMQKQLLSIVDAPEQFKWQKLPVIPKESYRICDSCTRAGEEYVYEGSCIECNGNGEMELDTNHNCYTVTCKSCDGEGAPCVGTQPCSICKGTKKHTMFVPLGIDGLGNSDWDLNSDYVRDFSELENCQITWVSEWEMFALKFKGGVAIILPMRK